ncbi:acetyltransferase [Lysinibacillus contaminans]|uniref:Acetyltransferase n=1 Tax=Lysinibacillus contaminans TaxID=1293441 RepID=A0ABR5K1I6_9BACI|nr:GNAT family N-acetyltransferase [Lysinibacillus contaminans]KOS68807.1 acetyltransferase [Lysinibacillus contaminans]
MSSATIRLAKINDAARMLEIQKDVITEDQYLMTTFDEFNQTLEGKKVWIEEKLINEYETILVAEIDNSVVGWLVFRSPNRKRIAHTGTFGMMIDKQYRGQGLGKQLLQGLLKWAKENPLIEKVCLGVFSTNENAIALYKKMGFIEEGRKINEIKLSDNEYVDDVLMYQFVK